ncbi:putative riboflavin kinase [Diplonema papillatum]|nr:putative riboflavin kinase [Diplonema papillatum]|eukprot:gene21020-32388_t
MPAVTASLGLPLPFFMRGLVVKGFQRGSKELGFPTANLEFATAEAKQLKARLQQGVYFGFARVAGEKESKMMAMSVGDNPHYGNADVTVEVHILHEYPNDFYGKMVTCVVVGYVRPMVPFDTLDALIAAINNDCMITRESLKVGSQYEHLANHPFFTHPDAGHAAPALALM